MPNQDLEIQELPVDDDKTPITPKKQRFTLQWNPGKVGPAFWTIASMFSMTINLVLLVALLVLGRQLFSLKQVVQEQVLGGLYTNFQMMDEAHIRTTIPVSTEVPAKFDLPLNGLSVPAKFDLPLNTQTTVTLTQDTMIRGATLYNLNAGSLYISQAKLDINLPAGTELPVALNLTVPVDQMIPLDIVVPVDQKIPVDLLVEVDIPLSETELHPPFVGLQEVVKPYYTLLGDLPDSWQAVFCGSTGNALCDPLMP